MDSENVRGRTQKLLQVIGKTIFEYNVLYILYSCRNQLCLIKKKF